MFIPAHMLMSLTAPGRAQVAGVGGVAQGAPTVALMELTVWVKNAPPVAPVTPQKAVGEESAAARLMVALRVDTRPAPDTLVTDAVQVQGL